MTEESTAEGNKVIIYTSLGPSKRLYIERSMQRRGGVFTLLSSYTLHTLGNESGGIVIGRVLSRRFRAWQHRPSEGEDTITFNFSCFLLVFTVELHFWESTLMLMMFNCFIVRGFAFSCLISSHFA